MEYQNLFTKEDPPNDDPDEPNKRLYLFTEYHHFSDIPETKKLLEDSDSDENTSIVNVSNSFKVGYSESPRTKLSQFIPTSPCKTNGNLCDNKIFVNPLPNGTRSFNGSLSMADEEEQTSGIIFLKEFNCGEERIQSMHNVPTMIRSLSKDILQIPSDELSRDLSRTSGIAGDEAELPQKRKFTSEQKWIAFCLCFVDFTTYLSMSIIAPFFPKEAAAKGMREAVSGFVFSIYALVMMLTSPIFGKLIPTVGAKFMFLSGVGVCGSCNILFGLLDRVNGQMEFTVLCFLVRSFEALGAAAFNTASWTIIIDQFPDDIGTVFGFSESCIAIGMSVGPAIGSALYAAGGFGTPFFTLGGFVVLIVPFCWYLLKNVKDPEEVLTPSVSYMKLLSMPHVVVVCLILAVTSQAQGFINPTLEPHMRQYNLDTSVISLLFVLLSAAYAISSPIVGWVSGKVENKYPIMIVGLMLVTLALLLLGPSDFLPIDGSVWLSVVALILLGFSYEAAYVPTFESMFIAAMNGGLEDDINTYSVVAGLWSSMFSLGEVTGPFLGGVLLDFLTFPQASTIMALCTLASFLVALVAWFNPCVFFCPYSLIEDAEKKLATASESSQEDIRVPSREYIQLSEAHSHTYGSLWEDN